MSIKTNAEEIRDETALGANTATRVGGNLVAIADDLIAKQTLIDANTDKISFDSTSSTRLAETSNTNTGDQDLSGLAPIESPTFTGTVAGITKTMVGLSNVPNTNFTTAVGLNTSKVGITTDQATAIVDNTTAIITKIGNDGSPITLNTANALTDAAYSALPTKEATRLYFTT